MKLIERSLAIIERRGKIDKITFPFMDGDLIDQNTTMLKNKILMLLVIKGERLN